MATDGMKLRKIAFLGPRGSVGRAVISELLDPSNESSSTFHVTAITRPSTTYTPPSSLPEPILSSQITSTSADFSSLSSLTEIFRGHDAVVNCISGSQTQYEPTKLIIDAVVAAGVRFYVANEFVGNITAEQYRRLPEQLVGGKVRIREYLKGLAGEGKVEWCGVSGGPFFDMWLMKGPAGFDIRNRRARIYGTGDNRLCWTPLPMMARAVANMLRWYGTERASGFINKGMLINGVSELSQNALLTTLEQIYSQKDGKPSPVFQVDRIDVAKINANARIALERGETAKAIKGLGLSNQFYEGDSAADFSALCENAALGVEEVGVEQAVKDAIREYGEDCAIVEGMYFIEPCEI